MENNLCFAEGWSSVMCVRTNSSHLAGVMPLPKYKSVIREKTVLFVKNAGMIVLIFYCYLVLL